MRHETRLVDTIENDKYLFEVFNESPGKWYVNATSKDDPTKFFHKWTTGRTRKSVVGFIERFNGFFGR